MELTGIGEWVELAGIGEWEELVGIEWLELGGMTVCWFGDNAEW